MTSDPVGFRQTTEAGTHIEIVEARGARHMAAEAEEADTLVAVEVVAEEAVVEALDSIRAWTMWARRIMGTAIRVMMTAACHTTGIKIDCMCHCVAYSVLMMRGVRCPHVMDYSYVGRVFAMVLYVSGTYYGFRSYGFVIRWRLSRLYCKISCLSSSCRVRRAVQ